MSAPLSIEHENADERFMRIALESARRGQGWVEPNPMVGCVIVRDNVVIGQGFHRQFGGPHAEIEALDSLGSAGDANGATAYVSLEPCCHHGKTPPCANALIRAGIGRVVVAMVDPFAEVDGGGLRQLNDAGIETTVGVLGEQAENLNAPYLKKVRTGKPWVIAKWAMTVDGRIATAGGESQWITGEASRAEVHQLRGRVDAIAVGMGTVEADDPMLTARLIEPPPRVATRVVFCRHRVPAIASKLVQSASEIPTILIAGPKHDGDNLGELESRGVVVIDTDSDDPIEMVSATLSELGKREMTNVMLEGGGELLASFLTAGQIDECHVYIGAKAFGGMNAKGPIAGSGVQKVADAWSLELVSVDQFEHDVRVVYRKS
jgi:diaminohydroxyphosphoribosylaminopyrimidine deaminase/5-amino-6-(5-phosphoribosylamino)uracil reductase